MNEKRRELLQKLSEKEFNSITELSRELERDKKNTSQDIKKLVFNFDKIEIEGLEYEEYKKKSYMVQ